MSRSSTKETVNALHNVSACQRLTASRPTDLQTTEIRAGVLNPEVLGRFRTRRIDLFTVCRIQMDTRAVRVTAQRAAVNQSTLSNAAVYSITADIITADGVTANAVDKLSNARSPRSLAESR